MVSLVNVFWWVLLVGVIHVRGILFRMGGVSCASTSSDFTEAHVAATTSGFTERGAGVLSGAAVETIATFDQATDEFVITSATPSSKKTWISQVDSP